MALFLNQPDREWLDEIEATLGLDGKPTNVAAWQLFRAIDHAAGQGDPTANRVIGAAGLEGLRYEIQAHRKREKTAITRAASGETIAVPARIGVRLMQADGTREQHWQAPLWYEVPWATLEEFIALLRAQGGTLLAQAATYEEALHLRDLYPETNNVAEACALHGIDPRQFDLSGTEG